MAKIRPLVKWHGGKYYLANWIISHFPDPEDYLTYTEPYCGMASVFFNKPTSTNEILGDTNRRVTNLFQVIREQTDEFERAVRATPYSEAEFEDAVSTLILCEKTGKPKWQDESLSPVEAARRDYVIWRQSRGGRGKSWAETLHRVRREMSDNVSAWLSSIDENLPSVLVRIQNAQIVTKPAIQTILKWDAEKTLHYLDPTYLDSTRTSPDVYDHEMSVEQHADLLDVILHCKGKVVVSSYPNDMYDNTLKDWNRVTRVIPNQAAGGKEKRKMTEALYLNF